MENIKFFLIALAIICVLFGIIYPLFNLIAYPVYQFCGGQMNFKEYMNGM